MINEKCFVVTSLIEDLDDNVAEVKVIGVERDEKSAKELMEKAFTEIEENYKENDIEYHYDKENPNCYIIANKMEILSIEVHESEVLI